LVTGVADHLQIVITCNYSAFANPHTQQFITARTKSSQPVVFSPVVVWQRFPTASSPLTLGSRNIRLPQLPASKSNGLQGLNCSSDCSQAHQTTLHRLTAAPSIPRL
jgi:hypothetical protein